jgi:SAM-dependent MidA family methyltransferase
MISYLKSLISNSHNHLISYADFISAALYHPELGYYMKESQKIGRNGDFITTSNISDVYGRLMAKWFASICQKLNLPPAFYEIGAGNGRFAHAFLQEWHESIRTPLKYFIIETSPYHRKLQRELLEPYPTVIQVDSLEGLRGIAGVVFSNELFDALPVHVVEKGNGQLFEVMIGMKNDQLVEQPVPLANEEILQFLKESNLQLRDKQRIEVPIAMRKMIEDLAGQITNGLIVTADYGYSNEEWLDPRRRNGSLRGYYQHKMIDNVLANPGEMDITTHIHFDYLIQKGRESKLELVTKLRQDEFLLKAGILEELENHYDPNPFSEVSKRNRAIRSLIMPGGLSSYFHIVIQQKDLMIKIEDLFEKKKF